MKKITKKRRKHEETKQVVFNQLLMENLFKRLHEKLGQEKVALSYAQLGKMIGTSKQGAYYALREGKSLGLAMLYKVCAALEIEPVDVLPTLSEVGLYLDYAEHKVKIRANGRVYIVKEVTGLNGATHE